MQYFVVDGFASDYKTNKTCIVKQFDDKKAASKWLNKQLRIDEAFFIEVALETNLYKKKNLPLLPTRKELRGCLLLDNKSFCNFADTLY